MKNRPHIPTNKSILACIPAPCPICGSQAVTWSPRRVWCTMCCFQTAVRDNEKASDIITRWNRAVKDGIGYSAIVQENNARIEREKRERAAEIHTIHSFC